MMLTTKQEGFSQSIAGGAKQCDAYIANYDTANMSQNAIYIEASRLMDHPNVALRVGALKQAVVAEVIAKRAWDLDKLVTEATTNMVGAREDKQWSAANGSLTIIGKATGLLIDKVDVDVSHSLKPGLSLEELEDRERRLVALEARTVEGQVVMLSDGEC